MKSGERIFFIVGAQRCGTSYLVHKLDKHPEIKMAAPMFPEPKFFLNDQEYKKGKEYYLEKFFKGRTGQEVLGEKSTSYIESNEAALKIKAMFPAAKVIISLRNPVERAISNYYFSKSRGIETRSPVEVFIEKKPLVVDKNKFSVSPLNYLGRGEYFTYIKKYFEIFGSENVQVLLYESIIKEQDSEQWKKAVDFLGIKQMAFTGEGKINAGINKEIIDPRVTNYLHNYYSTHNKELENFLKIDLSIWNF